MEVGSGELEYEQSLLFGEVRRAIKRKKTEIKSKKKIIIMMTTDTSPLRLTPRVPRGVLP